MKVHFLFIFTFLFFFSFSPVIVNSAASLELDQYTLAKILGGNNNVFVQFVDKAWERVKDWDQASKEYYKTADLIVATVLTSDTDNDGVAAQYDISASPAFAFFPKGQKKPSQVFTGATEAHEAFYFLDTTLIPELHELQTIASEFLTSKDQKALLKKAEGVAAKLDAEHKKDGELYVKLLQKVHEKGSGFVTNEQKRVQGLLDSASTVEKRKRDFKKRLLVLKAFNAPQEKKDEL